MYAREDSHHIFTGNVCQPGGVGALYISNIIIIIDARVIVILHNYYPPSIIFCNIIKRKAIIACMLIHTINILRHVLLAESEFYDKFLFLPVGRYSLPYRCLGFSI